MSKTHEETIMEEVEDHMVQKEVDLEEEEALKEIIRDLAQEISLFKQTSFLRKNLWLLKLEGYHIKQDMMKFLIFLEIINILTKV